MSHVVTIRKLSYPKSKIQSILLLEPCCNNQKIIILNQEKVILQLNDEVAKLKSHIKTLTKVPKEKKEEFLKDYKIPFNEKVIRRTEQAIRAETTNELVTKIKKNYKKSQKVYGLEIKRENLKIARDLEKAKQESYLIEINLHISRSNYLRLSWKFQLKTNQVNY